MYKRKIRNIIVLFGIMFFIVLLNADQKSGDIIYLKIKNPFNYPIYVQSSFWEVYMLKENEELFCYPDSSYRLNFVVLYKGKGFHYRTKKYDILPKITDLNTIVSLKKINPKKYLILKLIVNNNYSGMGLNKVQIFIPYSKMNFSNIGKNELDSLSLSEAKDTLALFYEMKYLAQNILKCADSSDNISQYKFKKVLKILDNYFIINHSLE